MRSMVAKMGLSPLCFSAVPILLTLFFLFAASPTAAADNEEPSGPALTSYTNATGKNGSTLKWTPYRTAGTTQRAVRNASPAPVRVATRATNSAMSNPFGDAPRTLVQAAPLAELEEPPAIAPKAGAAPSKLPGDEPAKLAEPAVDAVAPKAAKDAAKIQPTPQAADEDPAVLPCPKPTDKYAPGENKFFKSISELTTNINVPDDLRVREGMKQVLLEDHECKLDFQDPRALDPTLRQRWAPITYTWKASGLCHKPLYFEDIQLERYGHSCGPLLQPIASGAHFFLTVPILPYKMGLEPPDECMYTLGYYRPGSCAPYMLDPIPLSVRAGLAEAGVVTGLIFLIP
jgi:hypothetical protein